MRELKGRVAVITGAASGFGRELAVSCAGEGMKLALADLDEKGLAATQQLAKAPDSFTARCDVSKGESVEALAQQTYERFGAAHLVFNNAGVSAGGPSWSATPQDWQWVLGVNLMGVVHGIASFVPRMLKGGAAGHVVNTASVAGLISVPGGAVYGVSKHGVVTLSESLYHELKLAQAKIGVSVLCPAFVDTGITDADRNRPAELAAKNPMAAPFEDRVREATRKGKLSAADVARITLEGVKANRFYILTHPKIKGAVEARLRDILDDRPPSNPMP